MQTCRFEHSTTGEYFTGTLKGFLEAGPSQLSISKVPLGWRVYVGGSLAGTHETLSTVWVLYLHTQGWRKVVLSEEEVAKAVHDVSIRLPPSEQFYAKGALDHRVEAILRLIGKELKVPYEDVFELASLVCDRTLKSVWSREGPYVAGLLDAYFAARDA